MSNLFKKVRNYSKNINLLMVIIFIAPFLKGLQAHSGCFLIIILCLIGIICKIRNNKKFIMPLGINFICIIIYVVFYLVVQFYAIDKGMNFIGFLKSLIIPIFIILYCQYECTSKEKNDLFAVIPYSGVSMIILVLLAILFKKADILFYQNRMQGFFCYANSFGLFLLIGINVIFFKDKLSLKDYLIVTILFIGIGLTKSRAIIVFSILISLVNIILNKKNRKGIILNLFISMALIVIIYLIFQIENRVNPQMFQSSEFITRLIYYQDAVSLIKKNIWGYGYLGWQNIQGGAQTGIYQAKYIHNSILQIIVDLGIIPMIVMSFLLLKTLFSNVLNKFERIMLIIIIGHSMIDFDLEFIYFILLIVMIINFKTVNIIKNLRCY